MNGMLFFLSRVDDFGQKVKAGRRGILSRQIEGMLIIGIRGCGQCNQYVADLYAVVECAGCSDAYDILYTVFAEQLIGIDAHGRHAHAASLYGNRYSR